MDVSEGDSISQNVVTLVNICTQERDRLGGLCFGIAINDKNGCVAFFHSISLLSLC